MLKGDVNSDFANQPGARIYKPWLLRIYDFWVLGVSNVFAWRCSSKRLLDLYNQNIGRSHMDVGVGTGWYLSHCRYPNRDTKITLVDLSPDSLRTTEARIRYLEPKIIEADVLQPLPAQARQHDSIAINYLLHCLPGSLNAKLPKVIATLLPHLKENGTLFGATILGQGVRHNLFGKLLMRIYNKKSFFSNFEDSASDLERILRKHFRHVEVRVIGVVAVFTAKTINAQ